MTNVHKKRVEEIDILRGLAAILMVLGHSFIQYPVDISNVPWCATIGHFIYTFHMELFFVLAGFVYHCTSYAGFMKKKAKRLLIPYLFFGIATMLLHAYGGAAINGIVPLGVGIRDLLLYGGGYWFLYTSFFMFACYPLIEKICAGMLGQIAVGIGCLALSQFVEIPSALMLGSVVFYLPYFIAGHCAAKLCKSGGGAFASRFRDRSIWIACASLIIYCLLDLFEVRVASELGAIGRYARAMSIVLALSIGARYCSIFWRRHPNMDGLRGLFVDCSKFSLQIYLFNGYLMTAIRILLCQVLGVTAPLPIVLGIWIGDLVISLLVCKAVLPRIPVLRDLCGLD